MARRFKGEIFDAPAERHISGAQVPKFLDTYLTAEERRFVERREKQPLRRWGANEY
jgi:hypothetical protein